MRVFDIRERHGGVREVCLNVVEEVGLELAAEGVRFLGWWLCGVSIRGSWKGWERGGDTYLLLFPGRFDRL
jgi:hypothetical protein